MSQKGTGKAKPEDQPIVEGEILDGLAGLKPDQSINEGKSSSKILLYLFFIFAVVFGTWWFLPAAKEGLSNLSQNIFGSENVVESVPVAVPMATVDDLAMVQYNLQQIEARLAVLENSEDERSQAFNDTGDSLANIKERLGVLEAAEPQIAIGDDSIERLAGLRQEVEQLAARLTAQENVAHVEQSVETAPLTELNSEVEYFMTLVHLSRAVTTGRPYETEILAIETFYPNNQAIGVQLGVLRPWSKEGVPNDNDINEALKAALPMVLSAEEGLVELSWWQRAWAGLKGLVTIRKTGDVQGEDIGAIMARAEVRIKKGNYDEALELLRSTTLIEQQSMAQLLEMLEARTQTQTAINELLSLGLRDFERDQGSQ